MRLRAGADVLDTQELYHPRSTAGSRPPLWDTRRPQESSKLNVSPRQGGRRVTQCIRGL